MSFLEFLASVISSTAWPVVAFYLVYKFGPQIAVAIGKVKLSKINVMSVEAGFTEQVEAAEKEISPLRVAYEIINLPVPLDAERLLSIDPKYAVLDAWRELESEVRKLSARALGSKRTWNTRRHVEEMVREGIIKPEISVAIQELTEARNKIVHSTDYELSPTAARRYIDIAVDVSEGVRRIANDKQG